MPPSRRAAETTRPALTALTALAGLRPGRRPAALSSSPARPRHRLLLRLAARPPAPEAPAGRDATGIHRHEGGTAS